MVVRKDVSLDLRPGLREGPLAVSGSGYGDGASLSGHERNHLFLNDRAGGLADVSGISGLDDDADGRALAWADFDRDGWLDFVVANANAPAFQLYRNEMGSLPAFRDRRSIGVKLVGGSSNANPTGEWSNRDGIGARVEVDVGDDRLVQELRAGEGFAAQNSSTLVFGLGEAPEAARVRVQWPSGRTQTAEHAKAGSVLTFFENPADGPKSGPVATARLRPSKAPPMSQSMPARQDEPLELSAAIGPGTAPMRLLLTTATWCEACRSELPDVARLRETFPTNELEIIAIPTDPEDDESKLREYVRTHRPEYRMVYERTPDDVSQINEIIERALRRDVLPAAVVTDGRNRVLEVFWGLPTISDIRRLVLKENAS